MGRDFVGVALRGQPLFEITPLCEKGRPRRAAPTTIQQIREFLPSSGILSIQRLTQAREVRIKSHKTSRALEECSAPGFIAQPVERALTIARSETAMARQAH